MVQCQTVCIALKYRQPKKVISKYVDKADKIQLKKLKINFKLQQQPDSVYITESGLYSLLISSRSLRAKKFLKWITSEVLPYIRRSNISSSDSEINKLLEKINDLETKNKILLNDLKIEKYPNGGIIYVTDEYDIDGTIKYKIGKTDDINKST